MKVERKVERQRIPAPTGLFHLEECARSRLAFSPFCRSTELLTVERVSKEGYRVSRGGGRAMTHTVAPQRYAMYALRRRKEVTLKADEQVCLDVWQPPFQLS